MCTLQHGIPSETQLVQRYAQLVRVPFPDPYWEFYMAFHAYKVRFATTCIRVEPCLTMLCNIVFLLSPFGLQGAVIAQGIGMRLAMGTHSSNLASMYAALTPMLADMASASVDALEAAMAAASTPENTLPPPLPVVVGAGLEIADDYTHRATSDPAFAEAVHVHFYAPANQWGGHLRCSNRPNEGIADVSVCLCRPDGTVIFDFQCVP